MSNETLSGGAAIAFIEPPMSSVPSPSGTAKVAARRDSAVLLRVSFMKFPPIEEKVHVQVKHSRDLPRKSNSLFMAARSRRCHYLACRVTRASSPGHQIRH